MKRTTLVALVVAAILPTAGQTRAQQTQAQQLQTCGPDKVATAPDSRYLNHGDGTVTDITTGLMWKQCAEGLSGADCVSGAPMHFTREDAKKQPQGQTFAGHSDWRLPTHKELLTLVEKRCYNPSINATLFPGTPTTGYWSSTPGAFNADYTWIVAFGFGDLYYGSPSGPFTLRLVRDGK